MRRGLPASGFSLPCPVVPAFILDVWSKTPLRVPSELVELYRNCSALIVGFSAQEADPWRFIPPPPPAHTQDVENDAPTFLMSPQWSQKTKKTNLFVKICHFVTVLFRAAFVGRCFPIIAVDIPGDQLVTSAAVRVGLRT